MYVSMTPHGESGKVLHCSQNDKDRKFEIQLYDEKSVIDGFIEQLYFPTYKGGTEQLLPINTSTPTTSNFRGTIEYPNGEVESEFVYRESPTNEDGRGHITEIKGNTIKFNQLVSQTMLRPTKTVNGVTFTNNSDGSFTINGTATAIAEFDIVVDSNPVIVSAGHAIYFKDTKNQSNVCSYYLRDGNGTSIVDRGNDGIYILQNANVRFWVRVESGTSVSNFKIYPQIFDLTAMSIDNLTTPTQVEEWLSTHLGKLDYYGYTLGNLISFKGTGLKITGKNLLPLDIATLKALNNSGTWNDNSYTVSGITFDVQTNSDGQITGILANGTRTGTGTVYFIYQNSNNMNTPFAQNILGKNIILTGCPQRSGNPYIQMFNTWGTTNPLFDNGTDLARLNVPSQINGYRCQIEVYANQTLSNVLFKPMIRLASVSDDTFEPYTSSTLNLPTLEHFPTGMKDIPNNSGTGRIYDETNFITQINHERVGRIDLGRLGWTYTPPSSSFPHGLFSSVIPDRKPSRNCFASAIYMTNKEFTDDKAVIGNTGTGQFWITNSSFSSASDFKTAMSGQYLFYELANPIITKFKSASLLCKGTEMPIYNNEVSLIEDVTNEAGTFDCKVKLQDGDDVAYSEKLSLFVERKPL